MSVQAISCAFALRGISSSEKLVLLALANYADENMRCWPSQETLARETELSERTVWGALKSLEEKRVLSRQQRNRADGTRTTDVFTLHFCLTVTSQPVATAAKSTRKSCEDHSQILREPVAAVATLTTFEPSKDPSEEEPSPSAEPRKREPKGFAEFWKAYPRKVGKGDARKKFERAVKVIGGPDPLSVLLRALDTAQAAWAKERREPRHIPHPSTWLNQDRWEDEPFASGARPPDAADDELARAERLARVERMTPEERKAHYAAELEKWQSENPNLRAM